MYYIEHATALESQPHNLERRNFAGYYAVKLGGKVV